MSDHPNVQDDSKRHDGHRLSAVAIQHDGSPSAQSRVIAKGQGGVAEQILQLAFASGVNVRKDADLVEILEAIDIDSEVPLEALATVAEILTYIYRTNSGTKPIDPAPSANTT
ncbi:MAG: EscU/YscU/HrcU family type III secretion system export apparatus switch protein [Alphaproteobacteria bacterium]